MHLLSWHRMESIMMKAFSKMPHVAVSVVASPSGGANRAAETSPDTRVGISALQAAGNNPRARSFAQAEVATDLIHRSIGSFPEVKLPRDDDLPERYLTREPDKPKPGSLDQIDSIAQLVDQPLATAP